MTKKNQWIWCTSQTVLVAINKFWHKSSWIFEHPFWLNWQGSFFGRFPGTDPGFKDNPQVFIRVEVGALERSFQKVDEPFLNNCRFQHHQFTHSKTVYFLFTSLCFVFQVLSVVTNAAVGDTACLIASSPTFFPTPILLLLLFLHFLLLSLANVAFTCVVYIYHSNVTANSGSVVVSSGTWCGLLLH